MLGQPGCVRRRARRCRVGTGVFEEGGKIGKGRRAASAISMPAIVTARASGLRRLPWQVGQSWSVMNDAALVRIRADGESAKVCSTHRLGLM